MSKPPIQAFETVKRYCEKNTTCKGCPLYNLAPSGYSYCLCFSAPENWKIEKEGKHNEQTAN